mgnify:CR=1 FL=1
MQWSSFASHVTSLHPIVDIANLSQRWFRRMFSLSASPHGKSFNHIWWIFLTQQKSVKISFKNPRGWIFFCFRYFSVIILAILTYYKQIIFSCFPNGFFPRRISPEETFAPKMPLGLEWMSKKCLTLLGKEWSGKSADISNFNNLGNLFTENVMIQTRNSNSSETFAPNQLVNVLVPVQTCAHYSRQGISLRKNLTR